MVVDSEEELDNLKVNNDNLKQWKLSRNVLFVISHYIQRYQSKMSLLISCKHRTTYKQCIATE